MDKLASLSPLLSKQAVAQIQMMSISQPKEASSYQRFSVLQTLKENSNTKVLSQEPLQI